MTQLLTAGEPLESARAAMVLLHGRGASADDILFTSEPLATPGFAFLAPNARGGAWYPQPFTAPLEANEPWLSQALATVAELAEEAQRHVGASRLLLLGFSQGACLALEYAARNPRRYGGVVGWSGGLIGPDRGQAPRSGSLEGTPVLLGCSDDDPYIPAHRVQAAARDLAELGAQVDIQLYPGLGHAVNADEIDRVRKLMAAIASREEEVA
jgi:phospholipase/carboxylesterase